MLTALDEALGSIAAAWMDVVCRRARSVTLVFVLLSLAGVVYAARNLGLNSDEDDLFAEELPFVALRRDFYAAFPRLVDPVVVVIDADTLDLADAARDRLAEALRADPEHFAHVFEPGGGPFFEQNGLLYLSTDELYELSDSLAGAQPYLAELAGDPSLRGLSAILAEAVDVVGEGDFQEAELTEVLNRVADGVEAHLEGRHFSLSWADLILGEEASREELRHFLVVQPVIDTRQVNPAEAALLRLRQMIGGLGYDGGAGVRARVTGLYALAYEEMEQIGQQTGLAGAGSFVLVGVLLYLALRSARLVLASLVTLVAGLGLTAGFATLAVGYLNLISVAFAVLFIGLSIDFALHVCVRYRELLSRGGGPADALREAARRVGGSITICAATTAIGFYAFLPTDYAGVAELGLIAGTGMLISLVSNLTLLPALLCLMRSDPPPLSVADPRSWLGRLRSAPIRHARGVVAATALSAAGAAVLCAQLRFDPNPLRMRDPSAPSVQVFNELLADGTAFPWNVNVLAEDGREAEALAERLEALEHVDYTVSLHDYVPEEQEAKLEILADAQLLLGPAIEQQPTAPPPTHAEQARALEELRAALARVDAGAVGAGLAGAARRLEAALARFAGGADADAVAGLEESLVGSLPERLRLLRTALGATRVGPEDLPDDLVERMVADDGRVRIEIFPKGDLNDNRALRSYVESVRRIEPSAFGEGVVILESGSAVTDAFREALVTASTLIFLLILALWRRLSTALLVVAPLALASLFTGAAAVLLGIPLNFANVIVIPLLLGMGVDSAIHLVHRFREGATGDRDVLGTSTAKAVLYSALTTIASFGTLGLSTHLGMASLGWLLTIGISMTLLCSLAILPALLTLLGARAAQARSVAVREAER